MKRQPLSLRECWDARREVYADEIKRQDEIRRAGRKIELIGANYPIIKEVLDYGVSGDCLAEVSGNSDTGSILDRMVAEGVLEFSDGVYNASNFTRDYMDSIWGQAIGEFGSLDALLEAMSNSDGYLKN